MTTPCNWQKSSYSGGGEGNNCVEVAHLPARTAIRDSKVPTQGTLTFLTGAFTTFVDALKGPDRSMSKDL
ncbi:DUF397 domain-containing protein [Streptomyces sp. NPDC002790]|uniref:DUF397 domain-containing protein n=1 Tax=Streptomyces sp. NPDC002790 TaxID=3154431 RepID=UPI003317EBB8